MKPAKKIWMDGDFVDWDDARIHVLTHTLHYGLGVFEGIRCYKTSKGSAVFRLPEHIDRFYRSAHIVGMDPNVPKDDTYQAVLELIRRNGHDACYIRPIMFLGYGTMGVSNLDAPVHSAIATWEWGAYLGEEGLAKGIRVKISSFTSHHINSYMTKSKTCANYAVSQMAKMEAVRDGYDEAIMLDAEGAVAQGSGENVFIIRDGTLKTPPLVGVLEGITRDSVIKLANAHGLETKEESFARDELYIADEAFFTGTAAEITPIREVDNRQIGSGRLGPVTKTLQESFFETVRGESRDHEEWLTFV